MNFDRFFPKRNKKEAQPLPKILPFDIRYALQYKGGLLNGSEIEAFSRSNFIEEAFYLTSKGLVGNPDIHKAFLGKYIAYVLGKDTKKSDAQEIISNALNSRSDISVQGKKLAQISRQGFDFWQEKFQSLATELSNDERNIFLLAHTTLVGFDSFLKAFSEKNKTLNILIPEWVENEEFGYAIDFNNGQAHINWLRKTLGIKGDSVLVDDTRKTGATLGKFSKFLTENGSPNIEPKVLFVS